MKQIPTENNIQFNTQLGEFNISVEDNNKLEIKNGNQFIKWDLKEKLFSINDVFQIEDGKVIINGDLETSGTITAKGDIKAGGDVFFETNKNLRKW